MSPNVLILGLASLLTDVSTEMVYPLLPLFLTQTLGASPAILGLIEGMAESIASLLRVFSGYLSDRLGRRKPLTIAGYAASTLGKVLLYAATAWTAVLGGRLVDRFGKGVRTAPRDALIADSCEPAFRGKAFGLQKMLDNLGGVCGMLIAAALLEHLAGNYRKVFLVTAIPASCVIFVILLLVRDQPPTTAPAKLRLTLQPFDTRFRWFLLTVAVFTLGNSSDLFILWRLSDLGLPDPWVPLVWCGHTAIRMLAALPAGILADRFGKRRIVLAGWVVYAGVYAGLGLTASLQAAFVLVAVYALYWSLADSVLRAIVADLVPDDLRGTAYGLFHFCVGVAILPANLIFGIVWKAKGHAAAFVMSAAFALVACGMLLALRRRATPRPAAP